jgi:putative PIN family toxin of toxin-antitoxin system
MTKHHIVIDTNVVYAALRSRRGASYRLLMLLGSEAFEVYISVPLVLEYEDVIKRSLGDLTLTEQDVDYILDYICAVGQHQRLFYLWRPYLKDAQDDMILELAVAAGCDTIITYNERDLKGAEQFGIEILTPRTFLKRIGEL